MADAICLGELLIDFVPTVTGVELQSVSAFKKLPGGAPANVAVGLNRFGISSAFMGKVGNDAFGQFLAQTLEQAGVKTDYLLFSDEAHTSLAFVSLKADGEREFMFYRHPGADMLLTPDEINVDAIKAAKLLHYGSISLIDEPVRSATLQAVTIARDSGCLISYDPNLRLSLWPNEKGARTGLLQGLSHANIVKISEDEVEFLTGLSDLDKAKDELWHEKMQLLVVTSGGKGSHFYTADFQGAAESFKVEAVDATGAGDGFVAGLLQGILKRPETLNDRDQLSELCRFANAVGALTTTIRGAIPALPDFEKVQRFIDAQV